MQIGKTKFIRTKIVEPNGRVMIAFTEDVPDVSAFTIKVTPSGMTIGNMKLEIGSQAELQDLAQMISEIWTEHMKLRPKLTTNLAGH
jgi:hypothetical protein